jgi:molecular chaperone GrpE
MRDRQALANQLLEYLDTVPELPDYLAAAPESVEVFDPYQLVGEWIALRQEVKQQNKLLQSSQQELQQALALERSRNDELQAQIATSASASASATTATTAPKAGEERGLLGDLLSIMDALDQAIDHSQTQIAALTVVPPLVKPPSIWEQLFLGVQPAPPITDTDLIDSLTSNQAGIAMIRRSLLDILQKRQIKPMNALGQPFDPQCMYAIAQQLSDTAPANTVIQEVVRGYWQGDRILREAQVIVASQPSRL